MWKTAITCGILAFVSATMTLWVLGNLFPPTAQEDAPVATDVELGLSPRNRYGQVAPRRHQIGPGSDSARAGTGRSRTPGGSGIATPAAPPHGEPARVDASAHADIDTRALLSGSAQRVGLRLVAASTRSATDGVGKGLYPLAIVSRRPSPRQMQQSIGVESIGHFVPTLVVHPDNPVRGLDLIQTRNLLAGRIDNWSEIGGLDAPVKLLMPTGTPRRNAFARTLIPGDSLATGIPASDDPRARLRAVAQDPNAITVAPLPSARDLGLPTLRISDQAPGVGAGYQFTREFFLITGPKTQTEEARRALQLLRNPSHAFGSVLIQL